MTAAKAKKKTKVFLNGFQKVELAQVAASNMGMHIHELMEAYNVSDGTVRTCLADAGVLVEYSKISGLTDESPMHAYLKSKPTTEPVIDEAAIKAERDRTLIHLGQRVAELNAIAAQVGFKVELIPQ